MSRVLPKKLKFPLLLKKFPGFYRTRKLITVFTRALHLFLSWARSVQFMLPSHFSKSILILFSLGLPSCLRPSCFPTKTLYVPLFSPYVLLVLPISCNITLGNTKIRNINFFQQTKISIALQQWVLRNTLGSMSRHCSWNVSWLAHWLRAVWNLG